MKNNNKTIYILRIFFTLLFILLPFMSNTAHAAEKWFYWVDTQANEFGKIGTTSGFDSKTECESSQSYIGIGAGHPKSDGCYRGNDVTLTGFNLDPGMTGKVGDYFTITGSNLIKVSHILFGAVEAEIYPQANDFTTIRSQVPTGATTSKITIKTQYRGTAISANDFTVATSPVNNNPWTFLNLQGQYYSSSTTEAQCNAIHAQYNIDAGVTAGSSHDTIACVQRTEAQITASQSLDVPVSVTPKKDESSNGIYTLLAPIGNLKEVSSSGGTCPGNPDMKNGIGCYLNIIFKIAIGLCAALAVIMIVVGGIQYMGEESVFGKTEAKSKIMSAIIGLFIALGAYAILNTINPALTGQNGVSVDQVSAEIDVRDRADDPDFVQNIDSFDISNITINPSDYSDTTFLGYLGHQQGVAGASAILWSAKKGYSTVPSNNPFTKSDINRNMKNNFPPSSAQATIGTSTLTPANFLKYWAIKVAASKKKTSPQIPSSIDNALSQVASETGVGIAELRAVCRIESQKGCTNDPLSINTVNNIGYAGLFQLSNKEHQSKPGVWEKFKKSSGVLLSAYDNAYAAAQYFKNNLSGINSNWSKINS